MRKDVFKWLEYHKDEMIEDIISLCQIPSVIGEPRNNMPFGEGPAKALEAALKLCDEYGFYTKNYDNYVGTADLEKDLKGGLDILVHVDVVPAGDGWTVTSPYTPIIKDGKLYGRGTSDDKGPAVAVMYAMRALKECDVKLKKGVRIIIGTDEETGSRDIAKYYQLEEEAEMSYSPDAEFPVINIEKGMCRGTIKKSFNEDTHLPRLVSLCSGTLVNAVPDKADLKFEGLDLKNYQDIYKKIELDTGCGIKIIDENTIRIYGVSVHGSTPQYGKNALSAALKLISEFPLYESVQYKYIKKLSSLFPYGDFEGEALGIAMSDTIDGIKENLSITPDIIRLDTEQLELLFDCRTPISATEENCLNILRKRLNENNLDLVGGVMIPSHYVPGKSEFVTALLESYESVTGKKAECALTEGGTYVHNIKNGVAFGAQMPGIDTHMHGADEFMEVENIYSASKIFAESMLRLCVK